MRNTNDESFSYWWKLVKRPGLAQARPTCAVGILSPRHISSTDILLHRIQYGPKKMTQEHERIRNRCRVTLGWDKGLFPDNRPCLP